MASGPVDPRVQSARLGALAALTVTTIVLLIADAASDQYELQPVTLIILLTAILTLAGFEVRDTFWPR